MNFLPNIVVSGAFKVTALAKSDIIAFTRLAPTGECRALHVLWAGEDQVRVFNVPRSSFPSLLTPV